MGVGGRKSQNNGLVTGALFFSSLRFSLRTHFALRAKYFVRLASVAHKAPQLCRLTCPWLKFLFLFLFLFVCLFVFSRKFESVGTFQTSGRDGEEKHNNVVVP